jgi:hypothetical protein
VPACVNLMLAACRWIYCMLGSQAPRRSLFLLGRSSAVSRHADSVLFSTGVLIQARTLVWCCHVSFDDLFTLRSCSGIGCCRSLFCFGLLGCLCDLSLSIACGLLKGVSQSCLELSDKKLEISWFLSLLNCCFLNTLIRCSVK